MKFLLVYSMILSYVVPNLQLFLTNFSTPTDACRRQELDGVVGWLAVGEEGFCRVLGKGQGHDGHGAGTDDQALGPQAHEPHKGTESVQDVRVVTAGLSVRLVKEKTKMV